MAYAHCYTSWHVDPMGARALTFLDSAQAEFKRADEGHDYAEVAIFPATYLLRHGLECFAKQMTVYHAYDYRNASLLYTKTHSLLETWSTVREYAKFCAENLRLDTDDTKYVEPMHLDEAFEVINDAIQVVDRLDPDGTQYRYPETVAKDKVTKTRTLRYQFPRGDINLAAYAAFAAWLVQAADITMTSVQEQLSWTASESRGHPGALFHSLVIQHYSDPSQWFPYGIAPAESDSVPPESSGR